ncbi:NADH-quinone oxidoreductase subunit K [Thermogymnomonas acidicola]|uniref:NADH-quinone oxidoreductase subunit K n=1 Tax=Thermogymnomonas acidicola TaxID=399579 RepID=A0AA37F946_9ARCH|nr:NADH-quinone oxidoreductase subunit NuoK [Thermogymnomonas acidicola]GGM65926.1 NADH-quinone oxidoreductase subunit K [Thermogymnomonas acidicola]
MLLSVMSTLSLILFCIGLYGIMTSNVGIKMLISIEIIINAAILNLVGAGSFTHSVSPLVFALFVIAIGAVESVVGISLLVAIYRKYGRISISLLKEIKW